MLNVPFELHVALRYLLAKRKQAFISVISFISTLGVTVGVMALVIALALMTGLQQEVRDRILGSMIVRAQNLDRTLVEAVPQTLECDADLRPVAAGDQIDGLQLVRHRRQA